MRFSMLAVLVLSLGSLNAHANLDQIQAIVKTLKEGKQTQYPLSTIRELDAKGILKCLPGIYQYEIEGTVVVNGTVKMASLDVSYGSCGGDADKIEITRERYF